MHGHGVSYRLFTVLYFFVRSLRYSASYGQWRSSWFSNVPRGRAFARWQPETQSARSRRSYGRIEDCEQCTSVTSSAGPLSPPFFLTTNFSPTPTAKDHSWQLLTITSTIVNFTELGFTLSALSDISPVYSCLIFRQPHNLFDSTPCFKTFDCVGLAKFLGEFDFVRLPKSIERLTSIEMNAERLWNLVID